MSQTGPSSQTQEAAPLPRRLQPRWLARLRLARAARRSEREIAALSTPPWRRRRFKRPPLGRLAGVAAALGLLVYLSWSYWPDGNGPGYKTVQAHERAQPSQRRDEPSQSSDSSQTSSPAKDEVAKARLQVVETTEADRPLEAAPKPRLQAPVEAEAERGSGRLEPDLLVRGAPSFVAGEPTLIELVSELERFIAASPAPTEANVGHWLYLHAWVVTGAKWGWPTGEEALLRLVAVDERVFSLWGIGRRSQERARYALRQLRYMRAHPEARSTDWLESYALPR